MAIPTPVPGVQLTSDRAGFGLASAHATRVELALWSAGSDPEAADIIPLQRVAPALWWCEVAGDCSGLRYGYHVDGPRQPQRGHRFSPALRLLDPRAPAVGGSPRRQGGGLHGVLVTPPRVVEASRVRRPWSETVIYEAHVKGLTRLHPDVPAAWRGTYLGLTSEPVLDHLRRLGVTAIQLLPVQHHVNEARLVRLGLSNYWGYSPVGFFAPHAGFATDDDGRQVAEFRTMVEGLHAAGFEVLIDLVLNHCGEGRPEDPTLSLRGIDNASYYRLDAADPACYLDFTGCGNTLAAGRSIVRELILDCARWWVERLNVDGFRLDLAPTLFRGEDGAFDPEAPAFAAIAADPVLSGVKWIAEPWDLGPDGHCLGRFPSGWREWNDRFRDGLRRFWRGDRCTIQEAAPRLLGSPDLLGDPSGSRSINYVTCHDGFTLRDLVSYSSKRNEANGEGNLDGAGENWSCNWGVEGPTFDPAVRGRRRRVRESLLASLLLARGVPMLGHGDELGRTQSGNNNAYCHDGPLTWVDWAVDPSDDLRDLVAAALALRRAHLETDGERSTAAPAWREIQSSADGEPPGLVVRLTRRLSLACNPGEQPLALPPELAPRRPRLATATPGPPATVPAALPPHSLLVLEGSD